MMIAGASGTRINSTRMNYRADLPLTRLQTPLNSVRDLMILNRRESSAVRQQGLLFWNWMKMLENVKRQFWRELFPTLPASFLPVECGCHNAHLNPSLKAEVQPKP